MKYLITGSSGFIGYHVAKELCFQGHSVIGIDNMNHYYDVALKTARERILDDDYEVIVHHGSIVNNSYQNIYIVKDPKCLFIELGMNTRNIVYMQVCTCLLA
mgnify:CR=1 FL=1